VLWAVVLLPPLLRSRTQHTADSIVDFNFKLDVLGRTNGNVADAPDEAPTLQRPLPPVPALPGHAVPRATMPRTAAPRRTSAFSSGVASRSAKRRRAVMRGLTLAVICTLLLAFVAHSAVVWGLQGLVDVLAATYVGLWAWMRSVQAERMVKVRYIPDLRVPELRRPEMALRRSVSS
jgi:hypothetical protein